MWLLWRLRGVYSDAVRPPARQTHSHWKVSGGYAGAQVRLGQVTDCVEGVSSTRVCVLSCHVYAGVEEELASLRSQRNVMYER